jgi:hypothetical protein
MAKLEDIALFESANSAVAFRGRAYAPSDAARFLSDVLALANAEVDGPRFLFVGVRDVAGSERSFPGVDAEAMSLMRRTLPALLARSVEPPFKIVLRALKIRGATVALLCLSECNNPPYLLRKNVAGLPAGVGWLRRGTRQAQLTRADLQRLFERRAGSAPAAADVKVVFAGEPPREDLELPVLDLAELPSAIAAGRLRQMLEAKNSAKEVLGRTETRFDRLMHAQIFGVERPYESHGDESLRLMIDKAKVEHAVADRHYELAVRAHKLDLVVCNRGSVALDSVMLRVRLPNLPGIGVADRLYSATGVDSDTGGAYPLVTVGKHVIDVDAAIGSLAPGASVAAFGEPPRLWLREPAAGKSIALDYTLHAHGLAEPIRDTLILRVVGGAGAKPRRRSERALAS